MRLPPQYVPAYCVRCHGVLSRVLDRLSELLRCCHGDRKKIQTELQEKGQKEKCDDPSKYLRPVCSGTSVYSPDTNKGVYV